MSPSSRASPLPGSASANAAEASPSGSSEMPNGRANPSGVYAARSASRSSAAVSPRLQLVALPRADSRFSAHRALRARRDDVAIVHHEVDARERAGVRELLRERQRRSRAALARAVPTTNTSSRLERSAKRVTAPSCTRFSAVAGSSASRLVSMRRRGTATSKNSASNASDRGQREPEAAVRPRVAWRVAHVRQKRRRSSAVRPPGSYCTSEKLDFRRGRRCRPRA